MFDILQIEFAADGTVRARQCDLPRGELSGGTLDARLTRVTCAGTQACSTGTYHYDGNRLALSLPQLALMNAPEAGEVRAFDGGISIRYLGTSASWSNLRPIDHLATCSP